MTGSRARGPHDRTDAQSRSAKRSSAPGAIGRLARGADRRLQKLLYDPGLEHDLDHVLQHLLQIDAAHVVMLAETGCLAPEPAAALLRLNRELARERAAGRPVLPALREHRGLYFLYEREYVERLGTQVGGAAHMARSRNDINATVTRLRLREGVLDFLRDALSLCDAVLELGGGHLETLTSGFTHQQPAQPTTFAHYLSGVAAALLRPAMGAADSLERVALCPMGAGSGFGTSFPIDRQRVAELLGFEGVVENSLDAVASRDYAVEVLSHLATFGMTLTRLALDLQLWGSRAYGFLTWSDGLVSTSSMMPQKRNAYVFENVRGRAARPASALNAVLVGQKNTPFTNSVEMSAETTSPLWGSLDDLRTATQLCELMIRGTEVAPERMREAVEEWETTMTALADHLVLEHGLSFRSAHEAVGRVLRELSGDLGSSAEERTRAIAEHLRTVVSEMSEGRVQVEDAEVKEALDPARAVAASVYGGGPAPASVDDQLDASRRRWRELSHSVESWRTRAKTADRLLETAVLARIAAASPEPDRGADAAG